MSDETWGQLLFITFAAISGLTILMAIFAHQAMSLMQPSATRQRIDIGSGMLGVAALLMYVAVQPGLIQGLTEKRGLFLAALLAWGLSCAIKAVGWWGLRQGLLELRALEQSAKGNGG